MPLEGSADQYVIVKLKASMSARQFLLERHSYLWKGPAVFCTKQ